MNDEVIKQTLRRVEEHKKRIDFDTLGRTLAYSPFVSRVNRDFFVRQAQPKIAYHCVISPQAFFQAPESHLYEAHQKEQHYHFDAYMLDLWSAFLDCDDSQKIYENLLGANLLESISLLRRHSTLPIIHSDIFLESYQILESALFGADALMLPAQTLTAKELQAILDFAYKLELAVFVWVNEPSELKKAIFSGANMLFVKSEDIDSLLPLIPHSQIIASDIVNDYGVDLQIKMFD